MAASEGSVFAQLLACRMKGVLFSQHKAFCCLRHPPSLPMQWSTVEVAKGATSKHCCDVVQLLSALVRAGDCTWHQPPRAEVLRRQNISGLSYLAAAHLTQSSSCFSKSLSCSTLSVVQSLSLRHLWQHQQEQSEHRWRVDLAGTATMFIQPSGKQASPSSLSL